jgi:hypothetical protein
MSLCCRLYCGFSFIDDLMRPEHYEQTEESLALRQEYEMRRAKQVRDPG